MCSRKVVVKNSNGIHLRIASAIVATARQYKSEISLICSHGKGRKKYADAYSIVQLVLLQALEGMSLMVRADGPDESEAVDALCRLLNVQEEHKTDPRGR
ncbi:MAG: HPr family phosphocarrier protein [Chlamydiota bacterium]|nr:HPr family phosphocarrier protein [Chlamydiota bacterium]